MKRFYIMLILAAIIVSGITHFGPGIDLSKSIFSNTLIATAHIEYHQKSPNEMGDDVSTYIAYSD